MMEKDRTTGRQESGGSDGDGAYLKRVLTALKKRLLHNFGWKLISLVSAFLVWMAIMNMQDPYVSVTIENIPVTVLNESALQEQGKISDIESGRTANIKVRAPRSVADNLTAADFEVTADYRQMSLVYAVPIQVRLSEKSSFAREDVIIEEKSPEVMLLTLEDYVRETFRVDILPKGQAAEGYYVSSMTVRPNLVQIAGSKKQIDRIAKVVVEVDTTGVSRSFEQVAQIQAYDRNGYVVDDVRLEYEATEVAVEVTVLPVKKILLLITIEGTPSYGYECTGTQHVPTEITIAGTEEDLRSIYSMTIPFDISMQSEDVEASINIETYLNEHYEGRYVLVDDEKYVTVKAEIAKMPAADFKVGSSDIEVRGLAENYDVTFTTKNDINIKVLGSEEVLSRLTKQELKLYIDLKDYEPGSYYVSVYSDTEAEVTVRTGTIGVEITEAQDAFEVIETGVSGGDGDAETAPETGNGEPEDGIADDTGGVLPE
ncbi:MAG: hypothetical protein K2N94_01010 [Lachnospiraceae bacterium]|nr:hypothetical protein [Lachnospiraceae bacterium]